MGAQSEQAGEWQERKISYTREGLLASVTLTFVLYEMKSHVEGGHICFWPPRVLAALWALWGPCERGRPWS